MPACQAPGNSAARFGYCLTLSPARYGVRSVNRAPTAWVVTWSENERFSLGVHVHDHVPDFATATQGVAAVLEAPTEVVEDNVTMDGEEEESENRHTPTVRF